MMFDHPLRGTGRVGRRELCGRLALAGLAALGLPGGIAYAKEKGKTLKERNFQLIKTNGVRLRTVVEGKGPLVILLHGFPYGWYLWRHQIDPLVEAGFQVAVPDLRGYGGSDSPESIESYNIINMTKDVVGLADALGHKQFAVVGQDWGAVTAWYTTLVHPERVRAVVGMTYPFFRPDWFHRTKGVPRPEHSGGKFVHSTYFQEPGVAEAELDSDPYKSLRIMYYHSSGDAPGQSCFGVRSSTPATAKFLDGLTNPERLPAWLSEEELAYAAAQYKMSGFRGTLNWYRNFPLNAELTKPYQNVKVKQPSLFVGGSVETSRESPLVKGMPEWLTDLRGIVIIDGAGHSVPMERPAEVNKALIDFLKSVM